MRVSMVFEGGRHGPPIGSGVTNFCHTRAGWPSYRLMPMLMLAVNWGHIPIVLDVQGVCGLPERFWAWLYHDNGQLS
jgi:hypothetical protein